MIDDGGDIGDDSEITVGDAASGAAAGGAGAADAGNGGDGKPQRLSMHDALDIVRKGIGATKGQADPARAGGADVGADEAAGDAEGEEQGETADQIEARLAAMEPAEREAEEARLAELAANDPLIVDLGAMREGEEPIRIVAADQQMADHIRSLQNRAISHSASLAIREEAEGYRAQADELRYEVQLDPSGFLLSNLKDQNGNVRVGDAQHIVRVLLTQPGVLDSVKEWVTALAQHPEAIAAEARIANADRIERNAKVKPMVDAMKFENANARQCVRASYNAIEKLAPATWTQEQRDQLNADVIRDLQDLQRSERISVTDPKRVSKLVESRLSRFGVALNNGKGGGNGAGAGRGGAKTPTRTGPSGQQLRETDTLRRRAAGPGPGAGSPAAGIPKPPAGTKLTGKNNVFDHLRRSIAGLRRAP